jgi:parallel beta-helix repeat protein
MHPHDVLYRGLAIVVLVTLLLLPGMAAADGEVPFGAGSIITTTADEAYSVYAADVDGDDDMDVLSASQWDNKVWLNDRAAPPGRTAAAPCEVQGIIDSDTTWNPTTCDPYIVTGNLSVQNGATLTIQPGTTVKFDSLKALAVQGTLVACGTETSPITFTSKQLSPTPGDWAYIHFASLSADATPDRDCSGNGSGSIIQYAVIEYTGGASVNHNGALRIEDSSPLIDHNIITDNSASYGGGICVWGDGAPRITNNIITDNSDDGIDIYYGSATIENNTISNNTGNGINAHTSNLTIQDNTITGNAWGIYVWESNSTIQGNTITGNSLDGINAYDSDSTIQDNIVTDNSGSGVQVLASYGDTTVINKNTITGNSTSYGGGVYVQGSGAATISDNTITGNSATSKGGGIYVLGSGTASIGGNTIINNTASQTHEGGGIYLSDGSRPTINDNDLYGNMTGDLANIPNDIYNGNPCCTDVNAENNYWGTTDSGVIEDHIWHFMDDPSLSVVDYSPFRTLPISPVVPVEIVTLTGPTTGMINIAYAFTATVSPITTTQPITYVWQATNQSQVTHTGGGLSDMATFTWSTTSTQTVTVTATNAGGTVTNNHVVTIGELDHIVTCTDANGQNLAGDRIMTTDETWTLYAAGYDITGTFIANQDVTWGSTGTLDPASGSGTSYTFSPSTANTSGTITADAGGGITDTTGIITVNPGTGHHNVLPIVMKGYCGCGRDNYEPNDSFAQAHGPLTSGQIYESWISCCDVASRRDYFYINISTTNTINIDLTNIPAGVDYDLYLYNSAQRRVDQSQRDDNLPEDISYEPPSAGRYYILVFSPFYDYSASPYSLRVTYD